MVQPAAEAVLTEDANVIVKITPPEGMAAPSKVFVGLGGAPWVELPEGRGD